MNDYSPEAIRRLHENCGDGHCPPSCGTLGGSHFAVDAGHFLVAAGYVPADHREVVAEIAVAIREAMVDAAYDVMRDHGLKPETDPFAPVNQPPALREAS